MCSITTLWAKVKVKLKTQVKFIVQETQTHKVRIKGHVSDRKSDDGDRTYVKRPKGKGRYTSRTMSRSNSRLNLTVRVKMRINVRMEVRIKVNIKIQGQG